MESEAPQPPRNSAQLQARMTQLRSMVNSGLLEEEDIADEVEQLKAEARAWRVSTAASGAVGGCPAASQPQAGGCCAACCAGAAACDWDGMDALPLQPFDRAGSWAVFATSALPRAPETGSTAALRAAVGEPVAARAAAGGRAGGFAATKAANTSSLRKPIAPRSAGLYFLKFASALRAETLTSFFRTGFLAGGPTLYVNPVR